MKGLQFIWAYLKNPIHIGAIAPSSSYLAKKMVEPIQFEKAAYIVELGAGTGVFTKQLCENKREETKLIVVEYNEDFYKLLVGQFQSEKNVIIIHGSAENLLEYLQQNGIGKVDYIVSGLPFASLPKQVSASVLTQVQKGLKENGLFITFQYTKLKQGLLKNYLNIVDVKEECKNFPPAYVFTGMAK